MTQSHISHRAADNIRVLSAAMVEKAKSGHPGGAMGGADFVQILFSEFMDFDPSDMTWAFRDRFYMDPGHMSAMLYSVMSLFGKYSMKDLAEFRQWKSPTPGHPEIDIERGIENTSGPLGLGHAFGIGSAIAERYLVQRFGKIAEHKTYIFISDGGIQEEISAGVGRIAGTLGLGNVVMFYDANDVQLSTKVSEVSDEDTKMKYESWDWHVLEIDGNDHEQIREALKSANAEVEKPTLIIGRTVMGKGAKMEDGSSFEGEVSLHGQPIGKSKASFEKTIEGFGVDPSNALQVFPDVADYYAKVIAEKIEVANSRKAEESRWRSYNPNLADKLDHFFSSEAVNINWEGFELTANPATRDSSGKALAFLNNQVENLIVASADLSNSDKTGAFLNNTTHFTKGDFSGAFLQAGVSELSMAAIATGMALHGGVVPVCATFFVFSDYMKPAIRVASLMEQQVIFVWTHDSFRVGEDGPTHQPVEHEAQIRLLESLKNHSGKNGMLVLRPADSEEVKSSWEMMINNVDSPSGIILTRQGINDIERAPGTKVSEMMRMGGYVIRDSAENKDVVLVGNGSEVNTLLDVQAALVEKGVQSRVVSIPSIGVFKSQSLEYRTSVLCSGMPKFGFTAGLPENLESLVGSEGLVIGLGSFGESAPYKVLEEKFGFAVDPIVQKVLAFLNK